MEADNAKTDLKQNTVNRVILAYKLHWIQESNMYLYERYRMFLRALAAKNPNITVVNQRDSKDRFYRSFVGFPVAYHKHTIQELYIADCCHFKLKSYNGVSFNLMTKTGHGRMIVVCVAVIPVEDSKHLYWVLQMCVKMGIDFQNIPLFTDQGPLISAAKKCTTIWQLLFAL